MDKVFLYLYIAGVVFFFSLLITFAGSFIFLKIKKVKVKKQIYITYLLIFIILIVIILISGLEISAI